MRVRECAPVSGVNDKEANKKHEAKGRRVGGESDAPPEPLLLLAPPGPANNAPAQRLLLFFSKSAARCVKRSKTPE